MTLQEAFNLRRTNSLLYCSKLCNQQTVVRNILLGLYEGEDNPLEAAQEDLDILNGDKSL